MLTLAPILDGGVVRLSLIVDSAVLPWKRERYIYSGVVTLFQDLDHVQVSIVFFTLDIPYYSLD
jgi:hypothetical protein